MTWALILADVRHLVTETGWQQSVGEDLSGRTLGLLGLGNIGSAVARIGNAFDMNLIAWSQNLTAERAAAAGAVLVPEEEVFRQADITSIHLVLSRRTRGLIGVPELGLMKRTARLVNTSRGPIVDEALSFSPCEKTNLPGRPSTFSTRSRCHPITRSANSRTCWQHRI